MRKLISFFASLLLTGLILISLIYFYLESQLPDVTELKDVKLQVPLQVYTHDGQLIGEFGPFRRAPVNYAQIPPLMIKAILATEDQRFFEHGGVDIYGLMRAVGNLLLTGTKSQGGSTITMQVARNFYLTRQKTFLRKFEEILLAIKIDQQLTKEKILELYLNKIYFGQQAYGVAAAAQAYYGKNLDQLTLSEMAMLAGLPQAPSAINPVTNPIAAKKRRDHVLGRMYELGNIDEKSYQTAVNSPLAATYHGRPVKIWAPYAGEMARQLMYQTFGEQAYTQSYRVYTSINSQDQIYANQALREGLLAYDQRHGYRGPITHLNSVNRANPIALVNYLKMIPYANGLRAAAILEVQNNAAKALLSNEKVIVIPWEGVSWTRAKSVAALLHMGDIVWVNQTAEGNWGLAQVPQAQAAFVSLNPNSGAITSLVGGFDFRLSNFNRVIQAQRQPGSGFKPFIYTAALDKGYTLASVFNDAPLVFDDPNKKGNIWRPQNSNKEFYGPTRIREALAQSRNLISIRLLQAIGIPYAINYLGRFGFDPAQMPRDLTLALGSCDVTPLQLTSAYAVFANGGYRINPYLIERVDDASGKTVFQYQPKPSQQVISPATDFLMVSALKDVIDEGTGSSALVLGRKDLAGKTGTTNEQMDAWFIGFNGDVVATSWIGYDDPKSVREYGAQAALPIWIKFMQKALQDKPEKTIPQPEDVISVKIDPETGFLARPDQAEAIFEYFQKDHVPETVATVTSGPASEGVSSASGEPIF